MAGQSVGRMNIKQVRKLWCHFSGFSSLLVGLVILSGGCAPQKPVYDFTPPAGKTGLVCIQRCGVQLNQCKQRATQQQNQCLARARQQAVVEMPGRLAAYETNITAWETAIRRYERDMHFYDFRRRHARVIRHADCRGKDKDKRNCRPRRAYYPYGAFWSDLPNYPGDAPRRPTLQSVQAEIAAKNCGDAALQQCEANYRQCFTSCGGTVKQR